LIKAIALEQKTVEYLLISVDKANHAAGLCNRFGYEMVAEMEKSWIMI
jgi:hypothetical protein